MLSSNTLLPNLILLIDVTFSTPTGHYTQNLQLPEKPPCWQAAFYLKGSICDVHGTNFLAFPFITIASGVPFASFADVKMKKISRMLFTHTKSTVAVRSKFPD
jgi:hypothetical protein